MKNILEVKNINLIFDDKTQALKDVSFSIQQGEFCVIAGSNGSGKSVLMSIIAGLIEPTSGTINLNGSKVGLIFQDADSQILGETVEEDVLFGAKNCGLKKAQLQECVKDSLLQVDLWNKKDRIARVMSGGEKRRLSVAGILAMNRDIIIFDEPFANLDWIGVKQVCSILKELKQKGKTIIVLTHELEKVLALADKFIVLNNGTICFVGTAQEGLLQPLEKWNIKNPLVLYKTLEDLVWL